MSGPADDKVLARLPSARQVALAELFAAQRARLRSMVSWRLDPRLNGRVDPSDVLQEVYLDAVRRLPGYLDKPNVPAGLWLRLLTNRRLLEMHRQHLGAQMRTVGQE